MRCRPETPPTSRKFHSRERRHAHAAPKMVERDKKGLDPSRRIKVEIFLFIDETWQSLIAVGDRIAICNKRKEVSEGAQEFDELGIKK